MMDKRKNSPTISGMTTQTPDEIELISAKSLLKTARILSDFGSPKQGDIHAAIVAILLTALELATPNLSASQRAGLINQPEEN